MGKRQGRTEYRMRSGNTGGKSWSIVCGGGVQQGLEGRRAAEGAEGGVVIPVIKKGEGTTMEEYRGVTVTQTAYKVYTAVLAERLRMEIEGKCILPPSC